MSIPFDPSRVAAFRIPGRTHHHFVRGMMPLVDGDFAYSEIEEALKRDLSNDRFVSVSLIDNTGERDRWELELRAFKINPDNFPASNWPPYEHQPKWTPGKLQGSGELIYGKALFRDKANLVWWPIEGLAPNGDPDVFITKPGWDLDGLVTFLYSLYTNGKTEPTTFYFHCMLGADRTGALHAGLLMKTGTGIDDAIATVSRATSAGAPNADYLRLIRAYGKYLGRK